MLFACSTKYVGAVGELLGDTGHGNRHVPAAGSKLSDYVLSIKVICHTHAGTLDQRHWTKLQK